MRVQFRVVGIGNADGVVGDCHVDMDAVPREGEAVNLPGVPAMFSVVRTVVWYPLGEPDDDDSYDGKPFAYVVVGQHRPPFVMVPTDI